ncbi:hypothetical protein ABW19_dt0200144 [Dactylella cylindrospora]|nr:hypothetical protein ABW19_dt0200144 [Dactylella cylindrospora]
MQSPPMDDRKKDSVVKKQPKILEVLPLDVLTYLVTKVIEDKQSLLALSETCRALNELVIPRLRSHTVVLNLFKSFPLKFDPSYQIIQDFLHERNGRNPRHIRTLEIRDSLELPWKPPPTSAGARVSRMMRPQNSIKDRESQLRKFAEMFYAFLEKCTGLRSVLRDGYEQPEFNTIDLTKRLLRIPTLKILCLKIHQDQQWYYNETPVFVEYENSGQYGRSEQSEGLVCFSIALPMTLKRPYWSDMWAVCRQILTTNARTLKHFICDGPDMNEIIKDMNPGWLANLRLESLKFRIGFNSNEVLKSFGILSSGPNPNLDKSVITTSGIETPFTTLRRLEFGDFRKPHSYGLDYNGLLEHIYTPRMKYIPIFGLGDGRTSRPAAPRELTAYLKDFRGLECVDIKAGDAVLAVDEVLRLLESHHHRTLRTIILFEDERMLSTLCMRIRGLHALTRLEIFQRQIGTLKSMKELWRALDYYKSIKEVKVTMTHFQVLLPRLPPPLHWPWRILTAIYSTAFFCRNVKQEIDTLEYPISSSEAALSTKVLTPHRIKLRSMINDGERLGPVLLKSYITEMYQCERMETEPPIHRYTEKSFDIKVEPAADSLGLFVRGMPENLQLFELEYEKQESKNDKVIREKHAWKKLDEGWVHEPEQTLLPAW